MLLPLVLVFGAWPVSAQDRQLAEIRAELLPLRARPAGHDETRGAVPEFAVIKHQLRDWIESWLPELTGEVDEAEFAKELNGELAKADLFCPGGDAGGESPCSYAAGNWTDLGFLDELSFHREGDVVFASDSNGTLRRQQQFLVVKTGLGILCGSDESVYVYEWQKPLKLVPTETGRGHWQRILENEQNVTGKDYKPQTIEQVLISRSPYQHDGDHLILTLGREPWCQSNWHTAYYRLWHVEPSDTWPVPLLDDAEFAFLGGDTPQASVGPVFDWDQSKPVVYDVLMESSVSSIDGAKLTYEKVRHYRTVGDEIKRIDPVALSPVDFVDEWLASPWNDASGWSEPISTKSLEQWHQQGLGSGTGEYDWPSMHCPRTPDLWQVSWSPYDDKQPNPATYFLVRWSPPYHFRVVDIGHKPWPECNEKDPDADEHRTLFPDHGWR